ncbi:MAG: CHAT domain-containing protein, partial [Saprospiraceae bacterium]|nr:CHAT domain-containing protein [Saprospiraceae bacterium]
YLHTGEGRKALQAIGKMQEFTASGATEDPGTMSLLRARAYQLINDRNLARQNFLHAHSFWLESLAKNVEGVMNEYLETVYHYAMFMEPSDPDATYAILRNALDLLRVSRYSAENLDSYERLYTNHGKLFEFAARFFHRLFEDTNNEIYRLRLMQLIEDHHQAALNRDYLKYQVKSELIPDSMQLISQRILKLKAHIAFAQQELTASNKDTLQQLNARLNDLYLNWHRQVATIPHEQFSTSNSLIEQIDSVRRWCNQWKESILSYYLTDSSVFINLINADTFLVIRKDIPATEISRQVRQMVESITAYRHSQLQEEQLFKSQISTFRSTSNALYLTLIQPVEKLLEQRVTIIPDGVLFDLPYACLTQESPGREAWDFPVFLVESHDFSFNYSLHSVTRASTTQADAGMVCIAPFTEPNPENSENYLPGSAKELELLQSIMEVRYLSPELHKEQVVKALEKKSIIHISSHALAEFGHPSGYYLCINKYPEEFHGRLYLDEIYHLKLQSDLITLNACQTAKSDEGAISISRAFFLAGTKHVISTLWHIPDQHSRLLSKQMYQSLEFQGHVGASLAEAQRTYLKTHQGMELHPYHWNGYVAWGNGKIQIDTTRSGLRSATTWLTLGTLLLLMFISWLVLKKKRVVQ